jgi:hypothetical protein
MSTAEQLGLRELQYQFPTSRITVDKHGVAIIDPIDTRSQPRFPEVEQGSRDLSVGIGQATLLKLDIEEE